jgi:serine/threonine protein kinase
MKHIQKEKLPVINNETQKIDTDIFDNVVTNELLEKYKHRTVINSKYIFEKKIGSGSFGTIYRGKNIISNEKVAIKFEATTATKLTLLWESKLLNYLSGVMGVPKLRYFGTEANKNIIVMDLYSHNLYEEIKKIKSNNDDNIVEKTENSEINESNSDSDLSNRNNTPESDSLNDKINKYIIESTMHNLNPNYIEMNQSNKIVEDNESNEKNKPLITLTQLTIYEDIIREYYYKLETVKKNILNIKCKLFDNLSEEVNNDDMISQLNKELEDLNNVEKDIYKDINNIKSKIINHASNDVNNVKKANSVNNVNNVNNILKNNEFSTDIDTTSEIFEENIVVSLDTNIQKNKNNIIVKEITKYCIMILQIINKIHDIGIVHRDIKPENFMIGLSNTVDGGIEKKLYIIDFGLSSFYIKNDKHIINNKGGVVGTPLFMSIHIHEENTYSRRDDIISILYVIIYLIKDTLPWDGYNLAVYDKKVITTSEELCAGIPHIFQKLLDYAYSLNFEEKPDYSYMIRQCKILIKTL